MTKTQKSIKVTSTILLIQTIIWLIFTIISMSDVKPNWGTLEYIKWVSDPNIFFTGNYINATVMTFIDTVLFTLIFVYFQNKYKLLSIIAFGFIPIYALLNIVCYSIQIALVPSISKMALENSEAIYLASQLIQANSQTLIGYINGLAYAILGIPSIIYGILLIKENKRLTGYFLTMSAVMSLLGIIGYIIKNQLMSTGLMLGGIVFIVSLVFMSIEFKFKE